MQASSDAAAVEAPEDRAGWWSRLTYAWIGPLLTNGSQESLSANALPQLGHKQRAAVTDERFKKGWAQQLTRRKLQCLLGALWTAFGREFFIAGIFRFVGDQAAVFTPVLMLYLIRFIATEPSSTGIEGTGYAMAVGVFLLQVLQVVCTNQTFERSARVAFWMRSSLISSVFHKSLSMSGKARQNFTTGKIMNIVASDTTRLDLTCQFIHLLWSAPLQLIVAVGVLIWHVGVSALAGFGLILVTIPFQLFVMRELWRMRSQSSCISDQRIKITSDMIQGVKVIKLYAWEESFMQKLLDIRTRELKSVGRINILRALNAGLLSTVPILACVVTFILFVALGNQLTDAVAFSGLALFYALRIPLLVYPQLLAGVADGKVSLKRIRDLLVSEELDSEPDRLNSVDSTSDQCAITVENASFRWEQPPIATSTKTSTSPTATRVDTPVEAYQLKGISLRIPKGALVAVVGTVGAGKSSLLSALIGEMRRLEGSVKLYGKTAYCAQQAWIQNATLRDNILFGLPYDEAKYDRVIDACALASDLEILPAGDLTEIGEQGIGLSGGQKARVNLARAVYNDCDILLLDDILAAVDAHVGTHLFEQCIMGELKNKTRVLVTHRLHVLPSVDHIILMEGGVIIAQGTYEALLKDEPKFTAMVNQMDGENGSDGPQTASTGEKERPKPLAMTSSIVRRKMTVDGVVNDQAKLVTGEERATGKVSWPAYKAYGQMSGGLLHAITVFLLVFVVTQTIRVANDIWLSVWVERSILGWDDLRYELVYASLGVAQAIAFIVSGVNVILGSIAACRQLHEKALASVLKAPMSWFDSQPLGRIINRFSRDLDLIDTQLPDSLRVFGTTSSMTIAVLLVIAVVFPIFLLPLLPVMAVFYFLQRYYRKTSVDLKRLENVSRSPLFAHFSETMTGAGQATIRAYQVQQSFIKRNLDLLDDNNRAYYLTMIALRWISLRMELIASLLTLAVAMFGLHFRTVDPGLVALSITYSLQVAAVFTWCIKQGTEFEQNMSSVERLLHYCSSLPSEVASECKDAPGADDAMLLDKVIVAPTAAWPERGTISIKNLVLRYRDDLPDVLHGVSFDVHDKEKVGIVGRTGAGKSSLIYGLFLLTPLRAGTIEIDGKNIENVPLSVLRKRLAIIPQDPVIFAGTLRSNVDPFGEYSDAEIRMCLERCGLESAVDKKAGLDMAVMSGGENWSTGQRQLICLARAMVRQARILVLDEATASVDIATDERIQKSIREHFSGTVLTIAHRLNTIMDYNKIVVMDRGCVVEIGSPAELLKKRGIFYSMVQEQEMGGTRT